MGEVSSYPEGTFCWVDLGTTDVTGATDFYGRLLGWELVDLGGYVLCRVDGRDVTGIHEHSEEEGSHWASYVSVADVEDATSRAGDLGAAALVEPTEVPGTARVAVVRDPSGAAVALWQSIGFTGAGLVNEPGTWTWNDLATRDPDAARRFYSELFGWQFVDVADVYTSIRMGELLIGGMRRMVDDPRHVPPHWLPYFVTDGVDAAAAAVGELGGRVLVPPTDVPAGRDHEARPAAPALAGRRPRYVVNRKFARWYVPSSSRRTSWRHVSAQDR